MHEGTAAEIHALTVHILVHGSANDREVLSVGIRPCRDLADIESGSGLDRFVRVLPISRLADSYRFTVYPFVVIVVRAEERMIFRLNAAAGGGRIQIEVRRLNIHRQA